MSVRRDVPNSHGGHVDPEVALVDLEATVASIDNSRLLVTPKSADINSELLRDLLRTKPAAAAVKDVDQISRASSQDSMERRRLQKVILIFFLFTFFLLCHCVYIFFVRVKMRELLYFF